MKKIELLAPAGDLEKLKIAVMYGADAVYFGGESFSLRGGAGNFTCQEMEKGIDFAHQRGAKAYLALNIFPHEEDLIPLKDYIQRVRLMGIDAYIISDPGVLSLLKEWDPNGEIHLSTQANTTNHRTANFWYQQGVKRIVLAREMTLEEIASIRKNTPEDLELEGFIHGAMCISYSGRCLLSNFMIQRDANRGVCAHPCRWKYALVEEKRPGEYYPIEEDGRGTYILNSRDLNMIQHLPELAHSGISSFKIEGRMKSIFYVATVVGAYRKALNAYEANPSEYHFRLEWLEELSKASHREFTTGFYFNKPTHLDQNYQTSAYTRNYTFLGLVKEYDSKGMAYVEQRNKIKVGDIVEVMSPNHSTFSQRIEEMWDEEGNSIQEAPHPQQLVAIKMEQPVFAYDLLRKENPVQQKKSDYLKGAQHGPRP